MFFCAGFAGIIMLFVYEKLSPSPLLFALISGITITCLEFIFGIVYNVWLKLKIWDYSSLPLNIFGQICLPFSLIWSFFGLIIYYGFRIMKI